jgi:hypothetical protein
MVIFIGGVAVSMTVLVTTGTKKSKQKNKEEN